MDNKAKYFIGLILILFSIMLFTTFAYAQEDDTRRSSGFFGIGSKKYDRDDKKNTAKKDDILEKSEDKKIIRIDKLEQKNESKLILKGKNTKITKKSLPRLITEIFAPEEVRNTIKHYCETNQKYNPYKAFTIYDSQIDKDRKLQFIGVNNTVVKKVNMFFASANFLDIDTNESIVLDFDVVSVDDEIGVSDIFIKQVDKNVRFTYDKTDKRIFTN